jgi:hypothetical protein
MNRPKVSEESFLPSTPDMLRVGLPLSIYHILVVVGAVVVLFGVSQGSVWTSVLGIVVLFAGVLLQAWVLVQASRQARRGSAAGYRSSSLGMRRPGPEATAVAFCSNCGFRAKVPSRMCPRCGRVLLRVFGSPALPG